MLIIIIIGHITDLPKINRYQLDLQWTG